MSSRRFKLEYGNGEKYSGLDVDARFSPRCDRKPCTCRSRDLELAVYCHLLMSSLCLKPHRVQGRRIPDPSP
ncbi:hypothetical protein Bpfe_011233 [Biomphalaria pfeifferi]|uniref:Uncharacterized protein n=1 Tax=Biomphalaria pfeifferi TaxID=112525 RepID=A0AAD8FDQ8_BIOPF|nr:hypothetical protein Bpfe_011233 [Biomphalaria pfeifferi]